MQTVQQQLQTQVEAALSEVDVSGVARDALLVVPCANAQFGDYQWNGALPLAKSLSTRAALKPTRARWRKALSKS